MKSIRTVLAGLCILYALWCGYTVAKWVMFPGEITRCGTITFKGSYEQSHKYSSSIEFVLVVNYDGIGKRDVDVTASTWSSHSVGDRICFIERVRPPDNFYYGFVVLMIGGITLFVGCLGLIFLFVIGIGWIFTGRYVFKSND